MASGKVFSILGKNIKANTKADLEPYLSELAEQADVEEVHFGGNSLGVEACEAIAAVLKEKKNLKVGGVGRGGESGKGERCGVGS
jgi:Ran GTPase-activating protein 1